MDVALVTGAGRLAGPEAVRFFPARREPLADFSVNLNGTFNLLELTRQFYLRVGLRSGAELYWVFGVHDEVLCHGRAVHRFGHASKQVRYNWLQYRRPG